MNQTVVVDGPARRALMMRVPVAVDLRAGAALPNGMTEDRQSMAIDRKRLDIQQLTASTHRFSRGATEVATL